MLLCCHRPSPRWAATAQALVLSLRRLGRGFRVNGRRFNAEDPGGACRQPPIPSAEDCDGSGCKQAADNRGVDQDATTERGREHLRLRSWGGTECDECEPEGQRGTRHEAAG